MAPSYSRKSMSSTPYFPRKNTRRATEGMIVDWHTGLLGGVTHVNIRLADGEFVNNVPVEYFRAA